MPKRFSKRTTELLTSALVDDMTGWHLKYGTPADIVLSAWREAPRHDKQLLDRFALRLVKGILARGWPPRTEWTIIKSLIRQPINLPLLMGPEDSVWDHIKGKHRSFFSRHIYNDRHFNNYWQAFHDRLTATLQQ